MNPSKGAAALVVVPAIDLRQGRVVRLHQGDVQALTAYDADPRSTASRFQDEGARRLHVVDLDAAIDEKPQFEAVAAIIASVSIPVGVGGGVRTLAAAERYREAGAGRIVFGTAAVRTPELVQEAARRWADAVAVAIDARHGRVAIAGWTEMSRLQAAELARRIDDWGVLRIQYTDVSRDGTLAGPDLAGIADLARACRPRFTLGGGVAALSDISAARGLLPLRVDEIIVGKALYEGRFTLAQALAEAQGHASCLPSG